LQMIFDEIIPSGRITIWQGCTFANGFLLNLVWRFGFRPFTETNHLSEYSLPRQFYNVYRDFKTGPFPKYIWTINWVE